MAIPPDLTCALVDDRHSGAHMLKGRRDPRRTLSRAAVPLRGGAFAASGRTIFTKDTWEHLSRSLQLSDRESQIVQAVFDDAKETAIARELGISRHTVHSHVERLYRKVRVRSRPELIVRVFTEYLATRRVFRRERS